MRFVIKEIRSKNDWSGDDSEFRNLRDALLAEETLLTEPEPRRDDKSKIAPEVLALFAILGVT
ncbi:MAG TPA: hypothetical protein VGF69_09710 [Thermoanaerobaculia bacterium]|jgi:hypothetical protein